MKTLLDGKQSGLALVAGALLVSLPAPAAETNGAPSAAAAVAPTGLSEAAFTIISERNIFNSKRTGTVRGTTTRRTVIETFALTGTMDYEKGKFAVFEGTSTEFTRVLKPDGFIAGYKVVDILPTSVKLELSGQITELAIGTGMRREDRGPWKVSEVVSLPNSSPAAMSTARDFGRDNGRSTASTDFRSRNSRDSNRGRETGNFGSFTSSRSPSTTPITSPPSAADSADQAEVLKKLMERREKENQ